MGRYDQYSDEELIVRLREGETEISDYLMEKYKEFVRKKARAMFLIGGETDDLIQEGMIGLFKAIQNYQADKETSFRTFASLCIDRQLYSAVQNSNRQKHQPLNSYVSLSDENESDHLEGSWSEDPEALIIDQESTRTLEREITKVLSPMENKVLDLLFLLGNDADALFLVHAENKMVEDNAVYVGSQDAEHHDFGIGYENG